MLSGTPTATGTHSFNVYVQDGTSWGVASCSLTINLPLTITTSSLPIGIVDRSYSASLSASGGRGSGYTWTASGLPAGLSCNINNGNITGTPSTNGSYTCTVTVTDSGSNTAQVNLSLNVVASDYADYLLVSSHYGNSVLRYYAATGQFVDMLVPSGTNGLNSARGLVVGPDGVVYVVSSYSNEVLGYDVNIGTFVDNFAPFSSWDTPHDAHIGPDGAIYISGPWGGHIARYDLNTGVLNQNFVSGLNFPYDFTFGTNNILYVIDHNAQGGDVLRYNSQTGAFIDDFIQAGAYGLGDISSGFLFGADGDLYISSADYNSSTNERVLRFDATTGNYIGDFVTGADNGGLQRIAGMAFGTNGNLYVCDSTAGSVKEYDGTTGAYIQDLITGGSGGLNSPNHLMFVQEALSVQASNVSVDDVLATSATVEWTVKNDTDQAIQNMVVYWLTSDPDTMFTNIFISGTTNALVSMTLTNLLADQTYDYRVESIGWEAGYGYVASGATGLTFTTPWISVSNVSYSNLSTNSVDITWTMENLSDWTSTHRVTLSNESVTLTNVLVDASPGPITNNNVILSMTNLTSGTSYHYTVMSYVNDANSNGSNLVAGYCATNSGTISVPAFPLIRLAGTVCTLLPSNVEVAWFMASNTTYATANSLTIAEGSSNNIVQSSSPVTFDEVGLVDRSFANLEVGSNYWFTVQSLVLGTTGYAPDMTNASSTVMLMVPWLSVDSPVATNVTCTSATVSWAVENVTGQAVTNTVFYWVDETSGISNPFVAAGTNIPGSGTVSVTLTNLLTGQAYDYYVQTSNAVASAFAPAYYPNYDQFQTLPPCICIVSNATLSTGQSAGSATLNWTIQNSSGLSVTNVVSYTWHTSTGSGTGRTDPVTIASGQTQVSVNIPSLVAGATYYFNASSTVVGHDGEAAYSQTIGGAFAVNASDVAVPFISISGVKTNWVTDAAASIGWHVNKADPDDIAHHYVVATTNFPPFDLQQAVITEGSEATDQSGTVTALLTGLTPGTNYYYYVQSIIGFDNSFSATDLNGGSFYTFTTQDGDPIPPATSDALPLAILTLPMADPVSQSNAVIAWEFQSVTNAASHYVVFSPNTFPTPANAFIATATPAPGNYCNVAIADLEGLPSSQTNFYFVQSVIDLGDGNSSVMPMEGFYNWFITGTNGGVGTSGDVVSFGPDMVGGMGLAGGGSPLGGSGYNNGGGNSNGGGSNSVGSSGGTGGLNTGGAGGSYAGGIQSNLTITVSFWVSSIAVSEWGAGNGQHAKGKLTCKGSDGGVVVEREVQTDDIGACTWTDPGPAGGTSTNVSFDIPVRPGETYKFTFEWTERPAVDGYDIDAGVDLGSTNCFLWRQEDISKDWGESTICWGWGSPTEEEYVVTHYEDDIPNSETYVYPGTQAPYGDENTWTITVCKHPEVKIEQLCFDDNVRIKNATSFADTSGEFIKAPEWTSGGGNNKPICYVQGYNPVITNMVLHVTHDDYTILNYPGAVLIGRASITNPKPPWETSILTFSNSVVLAPPYASVNVYTTNNFPHYINYTDLVIEWTLDFGDGTTQDIGTTENTLFVILGDPIRSPDHSLWSDDTPIGVEDITQKRLELLCKKLKGLSDVDAIAASVQRTVMDTIGGNYTENVWTLLDPTRGGRIQGDCITQSFLMKQALELIGIHGAQAIEIHPCPIEYDEQHLVGYPPGPGRPNPELPWSAWPLITEPYYSREGDSQWATRLMYGIPRADRNIFEGCCLFNGYIYPGGDRLNRHKRPLEVLHALMEPNTPRFQFWVTDYWSTNYITHIPLPPLPKN